MAKAYVKHDYAVTGRDYVETEGGDTPAGGVSYSTEEREIGTWIDDSPVYERTFVLDEALNVSYNSWTASSIDSTEMNVIISASGIHADGTFCGDLLANPAQSDHTVVGLQTTRNIAAISIKTVILRYTKIVE